MYIDDTHCPICDSNEVTNITIRDFDGNAHLQSFDLHLTYICACMKCGVVFVPKHLLPKEKENN